LDRTHIQSEVLIFVPSGGKRGIGRPRLRFYDTIKANLKDRNIPIDTKKNPHSGMHLQYGKKIVAVGRRKLSMRGEASMG